MPCGLPPRRKGGSLCPCTCATTRGGLVTRGCCPVAGTTTGSANQEPLKWPYDANVQQQRHNTTRTSILCLQLLYCRASTFWLPHSPSNAAKVSMHALPLWQPELLGCERSRGGIDAGPQQRNSRPSLAATKRKANREPLQPAAPQQGAHVTLCQSSLSTHSPSGRQHLPGCRKQSF